MKQMMSVMNDSATSADEDEAREATECTLQSAVTMNAMVCAISNEVTETDMNTMTSECHC